MIPEPVQRDSIEEACDLIEQQRDEKLTALPQPKTFFEKLVHNFVIDCIKEDDEQ